MILILSFSTFEEKSKFEYIYNKYKKLLLYKAYSIIKDYNLAEDATAEAFIRIYKNLHKIEDVDSKSTIAFLVTIVKNVSITMLGKENSRNVTELDDYMVNEDYDLEGSVVSSIAKDNIYKIVEGLSEDLKSVFILKFAYDLSHKEIAKILKITENNVTVKVHRAKKKLINLMQKEGYMNG